jgi:hypothetical protein
MARTILQAEVERTYTGYVARRGTVPESEVSEMTRECFVEKFTAFHIEGIQIPSQVFTLIFDSFVISRLNSTPSSGSLMLLLCGYLTHGLNGTLERGKRLLNYVCTSSASSPSFKDLMTDTTSGVH